MILALTSALALMSEPVVCDLTPQGPAIEQRGPIGFTVACPVDHPDAATIQASAEASIAAMDLPLSRPQSRRAQAFHETADVLFMERAADGIWRPSLGQVLVRIGLPMPTRAVEIGARHMMCSLALRPEANGADPSPDVRCISDHDSATVVRLLTDSMRVAAERYRFAPVGIQYCLDEQVSGQASVISMPGGRREPPAPPPDPSVLPNLCEAG